MNTKSPFHFHRIILALLSAAPVSAAPVRSTFDMGADGWMGVGFDDNVVFTNVTSGPFAPAYHVDEGNPPGSISITDLPLIYFWFSAPSQFLGDQSARIGGAISYDFKFEFDGLIDTGGPAMDLALVGDGLTLVVDAGPPPTATNQWVRFCALLDATAGWRLHGSTNRAPTPAEFRQVMANLTGLYVRGEYLSGFDTGYLDNFQMTDGPRVIDFESIPGLDAPTDGMQIGDQFLAGFGVRFRNADGTSPVLAKVGNPTTAFFGPPDHTAPDQPAEGEDVGSFFLTDDGMIVRGSKTLIIEYYDTNATHAASGVIIDAEFPEQWTIEARNASGAVLDTALIAPTDNNAGDGHTTPWAVRSPGEEIKSIHVIYTGTDVGVGWAFDNFAPYDAPAKLSLQFNPCLTISGQVGERYRIEHAPSLGEGAAWTTLTNIVLTSASYTFCDLSATGASRRFYRATPCP